MRFIFRWRANTPQSGTAATVSALVVRPRYPAGAHVAQTPCMSIVCATRFTEESSFAAKIAAELARKRKQTLWLVHVLPGGLIPTWGDQLGSAAEAILESEALALRKGG